MEAIGTTLHYLKGASIKGDKTILQVFGAAESIIAAKTLV